MVKTVTVLVTYKREKSFWKRKTRLRDWGTKVQKVTLKKYEKEEEGRRRVVGRSRKKMIQNLYRLTNLMQPCLNQRDSMTRKRNNMLDTWGCEVDKLWVWEMRDWRKMKNWTECGKTGCRIKVMNAERQKNGWKELNVWVSHSFKTQNTLFGHILISQTPESCSG